MKKFVWILILALAVFATGCVNQPVQESNSPVPEHTEPVSNPEEYIASVKEQADLIRTSFEQDVLTQLEMNLKSQELYELWDGALNYLLDELKLRLPEEEFAKLQEEQQIWVAEKEKYLEGVGDEIGGSLFPFAMNTTAAKLTEERVYQLYELLNKQ